MHGIKKTIFLIFIFISTSTHATNNSVYSTSVKGDFDKIYKQIYSSLESNRLFVVLEPDIGANLAGFKKRWGENYNRNKLDKFKSMVFCNPWYANQMSNMDVNMTAICPLHITLTQNHGITTVHFVRPDHIAKASKAAPVAKELTELVINAINEGIKAFK